MATSVTKEGPYYSGNTSISFRSLQTNFGGSSNNVKFSTYYRNTDTNNTDPIVPDSTENTGIPTNGELEASDFRDSIKKYYINQSGGEQNYDIDAQSWNSNLTKNVLKEARINGTVSSSSISNTAATFNAAAYNLNIVVRGAIYGHEGYGANPKNNGGNASSALFVENTASGNRTSKNTIVTATSNGKIYGGGGGGGGGGDGGGGSIGCFNRWGYSSNYNADYGLTRNQGCDQMNCNDASRYPQQSPEGFIGGAESQTCYETGSPRERCRMSKKGSGGGVRGLCYNQWTKFCTYIRHVTIYAGGGTGGNGGHGQGANRIASPQSGGSGNPGGSTFCAGNGTSAVGQSGGSGGRGGYFGENGSSGSGYGAGNGGSAGKAIYRSSGNSYTVYGASSNTIKGGY